MKTFMRRFKLQISNFCLTVFVIISGGVPAWAQPPAPTGLTATAGNGRVTLNWNAVSGATSYRVRRATSSGGSYSAVASPTTNNYIDGRPNGTTFYYKVAAVNSGGTGADSTVVSATPILPAPQNLAAVVGSQQVYLTWDPVSGVKSSEGYQVLRSDLLPKLVSV